MIKQHYYITKLEWTGNSGLGTSKYDSYQRSYEIHIEHKPVLYGSSDPSFLGDPTKYNPEELLLASISSCHMLWYLHLCASSGIIVTKYSDHAKAEMHEYGNGGGKFKEVILNPIVSITDEHKKEVAINLHKEANKFCFIANSLNFLVLHNPRIQLSQND